jgi:hypothetical protein
LVSARVPILALRMRYWSRSVFQDGSRRASARKKAKKIREQARDGINLRLHRELVSASARSAPLFKDFATMICDQVVAGLTGEKSKAKWRRCIDVYSEHLHKLPINQIGVDDVLNTLLPIWRSKPVAARETRAHLQHVFGAAKALGHIDRNAINPATWEDNLKHLLPKQPRPGSLRGKHKSLPYDELPDFMTDLRALTAQSATFSTRTRRVWRLWPSCGQVPPRSAARWKQ